MATTTHNLLLLRSASPAASAVPQMASRLPVRVPGSKPGKSYVCTGHKSYTAFKAQYWSSRIPLPTRQPVKIRTQALAVPWYMRPTKATAARAATRSSERPMGARLPPPRPSPATRQRAPAKPRAPVLDLPRAVPAIVNPFDETTTSSSSSLCPGVRADNTPTTRQKLPSLDEALWLWDVANPLPSAKQFAIEKSAWFVYRALHELEREKFMEEMGERLAAAAELCAAVSSGCEDTNSSTPISAMLAAFPLPAQPSAQVPQQESDRSCNTSFSSLSIGSSCLDSSELAKPLPQKPSDLLADMTDDDDDDDDDDEPRSESDELAKYEADSPSFDPLVRSMLDLHIDDDSAAMSFSMDDILTGRIAFDPCKPRLARMPDYDDTLPPIPRLRPRR